MWERGLFSKRVTDRSGGLPTGPAVHVSDMIVSEKNQKSNRQNAQHSTGPKTPEGKAAIRFNALTYGVRTRATILERENAADYSQLWDELEAEWQPQNRTDAATWKPWSPHNGCSRGLPIARGGSTSSSNSAKNSSSCWAMFETTRATGALLPHRHRGHEAVAKRAPPATRQAAAARQGQTSRAGAITGSALRL